MWNVQHTIRAISLVLETFVFLAKLLLVQEISSPSYFLIYLSFLSLSQSLLLTYHHYARIAHSVIFLEVLFVTLPVVVFVVATAFQGDSIRGLPPGLLVQTYPLWRAISCPCCIIFSSFFTPRWDLFVLYLFMSSRST